MTDCTQLSFEWPGLCGRKIEGNFQGGNLSSDDGLVLLRQRIYGLALGYEDLNEQDFLRKDLLWQSAVERSQEMASSAPHRSKGDRTGTCPGRHNPFTLAQDRHHYYTQYTAHPIVAKLQLSSQGALLLLPAPLR